MRKLLFLVVHFSVFTQLSAQKCPVKLAVEWQTDTVLKTPESVIYDENTNKIYVTNINKVNAKAGDQDGFVSILKPDGSIEKLNWISGLNDPKGMAIYKGVLYVGDLTELLEIDIAKGAVTKRHAPTGAKFFNDVAVDEKGTVYASDSYDNKVYKLEEGNLEVWLEGERLDKPNGLFTEGNVVLMANMNQGKVYRVNANSQVFSLWTEGTPKPDGITTDGVGNYFVSNWDGEVYHVTKEGINCKLLDTKSQKINAADLSFVKKYQILVLPTFFGNKVVAYKVLKD
jgi:sugar lactone lactonase YvrE